MLNAPPHAPECHGAELAYFFILASELICIFLLSHLFQLFLKPLGQPGAIAQILAGLVLGTSGLAQIPYVRGSIFPRLAEVQYTDVSTLSRTIFMFLIGLEMDVPYTLRSLRLSSTFACGGALVCCILAAPVSQLLYPYINDRQNPDSKTHFALTLMLISASASSPLAIRMADEMKLSTSDVGRLAITASLVNDISCLSLSAFRITLWRMGLIGVWPGFVGGVFCLALLVVAIFLNKALVRWLNRRNLHRQYLKNMELVYIMVVIISMAVFLEWMDYIVDAASFFLGVMFPREGKAARSLIHKLAYPVYNIIFPLYFGYMGFQTDLTQLRHLPNFIMVLVLLSLNIVGKMGGTLATCRFLKIPFNDGLVLALLLSLQGHLDLLLLHSKFTTKSWSAAFSNALMVTMVINSLLVVPTMTFLVRRERKATAFKHVGLEWQKPDSELRILACVHGPRHVSTMAGIIAASTGPNNAITPYVMHLVELTGRNRAYVLYHTRDENDSGNDEHYGGNDAVEISHGFDAFTMETGITVHLATAVSPYDTMHEDVCLSAEDMRASIIFLLFHKNQRIDGKMEFDKEGIRTTNQRVLRHAPCSVGILVDRGLYVAASEPNMEKTKRQQVATLFFGGPDDREALAYSGRIGTHPEVDVTVFRFLLATDDATWNNQTQRIKFSYSSNTEEEEVVMSIPIQETDKDADRSFLSSFRKRYVTTGQVEYVEKYVGNGQETGAALSAMADMFALFIVGRGRRGLCPLTTGLSDWEECPELGEVGDLLASSDFSVTGSVLVIQQHREPRKDEEFTVS